MAQHTNEDQCLPTAGLNSSCHKIEVEQHPASIGEHVMSGRILPNIIGFLDQVCPP